MDRLHSREATFTLLLQLIRSCRHRTKIRRFRVIITRGITRANYDCIRHPSVIINSSKPPVHDRFPIAAINSTGEYYATIIGASVRKGEREKKEKLG